MENHSGAMAFLAALALALSQAAVADNFDGSKELLCAVNHAQACTPDGICEFATADEVGFPPFIEIEFDEKQISNRVDGDGERTTPIERQKLTDTQLILQGEQRLAWSIVISRETGKMTGAASGNGEGFVLFGACTAI